MRQRLTDPIPQVAPFFGQRLRQLRQARGLRVREVAAALEISASVLSRIERSVCFPDDAMIRRLAAHFGEQVDELMLLAGRLPTDLQEILQQHPVESARLLREHFSPAPRDPRRPVRPQFLPADLVTAIATWAIRSASDVVLDPSCGDGAMLTAVAARQLALGAEPVAVVSQLHGYEADREACARTTRRLREITGHASPLIRCEDFLQVEARARLPFHRSGPPAATVVVGALPSTAHMAPAAQRRQARAVAAEAGIDLPESAAPWAALLVHAASFVRPEGRLALVVPAAILHAHYAAAVRSYLARLFPALVVVTFERPIAGIGEAVVVLGDGVGEPGVRSVRVADVGALAPALVPGDAPIPRVAEAQPLRWSGASLPTPGLKVLRSLYSAGVMRRLGDLVRIDAGVVTGANPFFILNAATAERVNPAFIRPMLHTAAAAPGPIVHADDWESLRRSGAGSFLLCIPPGAELDRTTREYVRQGERDGIPTRATCRRRQVWYALPTPDSPAAFLTYLCPRVPRMLVNEAEVTHANALHSVRPLRGVQIAAVAVSFISTAALLSCELLGRHYGSGVLKLEPAEAENLLVPCPASDPNSARELLREVDALWRQGRSDEAIALVDQRLLCGELGVEEGVVAAIRRYYAAERNRRRGKSART